MRVRGCQVDYYYILDILFYLKNKRSVGYSAPAVFHRDDLCRLPEPADGLRSGYSEPVVEPEKAALKLMSL